MTESKETHSAKKRRKWPWITLLVVLILLGGLRLALRSDLLLDYLRNEIEERASETLDAELRIGRLEGDLWSHLNILQVSLHEPGEGGPESGVAAIDSIHISWSLADVIFRRPLEVRKVHIHGVQADLRQDEYGNWNILALLPEADEAAPDEPDDDAFEFILSDVRLTASEIAIDARAVLPDEPVSIRDLQLVSSLGRDERGFFVDIGKLDLSLHESRMEEPVKLRSKASWDGRRITLDRLLVTSAYTLLETSGTYDTITSSVDLETLLDPLSWQEAESYFDAYPIRQDLDIRVRLGGSRQDLQAGITIHAPGLEDLQIDTRWSVLQEPVLTGVSMSSGRVDAATLTGDDTLDAAIGGMSLHLEGSVPVPEWDRVSVTGNLNVQDIAFDGHGLSGLEMGFNAGEGVLETDLALYKSGESFAANLQANRWWDEEISWKVSWRGEALDPAHWSGMDRLAGVISLEGWASGNGLQPGEEPWMAGLTISQLELLDMPELTTEITAEVTADTLDVIALTKTAGAEIDLSANLLWQRDIPQYSAEAGFRNLDASAFPGLEMLPTHLNGVVSANGEGFDPETMVLNADVLLRESEINRQSIDSIKVDMLLENGIAYVNHAFLKSAPAVAELTMRQNLFNFRDVENRLDFDLELLDLRGFAGLAGVDSLQAMGNMSGNIQADTLGNLELSSKLDLHSLQYDTIRVERMEGDAKADIARETSYNADLVIRSPSIGDRSIRDISVVTEGNVGEQAVSGSYNFEFNVENESGFSKRADYLVADSVLIHTREMQFVDPAGIYRLQQPFNVVFADERVQVETISLVSDRESELSMALDKKPDEPWSGFFAADSVDLGQIQYVFLNDPLFEALFTGRIEFLFGEDQLEADAYADVTSFKRDHIELDSMRFALNIANQRLATDASVWHAGQNLMRSEFNLPFEPRDPDQLGDAFFEEEISGYLRVDPLDLMQFEEMLSGLGLDGMRGDFSLQTTLSGSAGSPEMYGELQLSEGALSGVAVDTLLLSWDYDHAHQNLELISRVHSLGQKAADISGRVPLHLDFRTLEFDGPKSDDPLDISIYTSEFNLAAFNDFLERDQLRNLEGRLDADIRIAGVFDAPEMDGSLNLSAGQIRVVPNEVTFRRIRLDALFEQGRINLERLAVQSSGSFNGRGHIDMDGLVPQDLDLRFNATNFRVFNTRDIEIFTGLDLRLDGSLQEPRLAGDVRWERGTLYLDDFGEREIEEVILDEEDRDIPEGPDFFERLAMEVNFSVDRNAFVRTRRDPELNLALRGEVDLVKAPFDEVQLFGDMGISSGHVTTFNKRFRLERGDVTFSGDPANPALDIRTLYQPRQQYEEINIYYVITGTLSDPEFEYESEPEMELQDIISYTLFGRPFHALAGWEQTVSGRSDGSLATNIAVDVLLDRIETLAADRLGIDVIEIENSRRGGGGTTIKAGKFISDRIFIAFLQELGGTDAGRQVLIEYLITRNLELVITAGDDYRSGVDMMWRYDY
ncbi:translocation/assembly module TamB domain-containing protein [Natronogracilivirga saccharolytica]|uniref:Translocation/assembly module TamB domain-containing protein n=1 Tax=Natronogracilivirga saccharolytica TaxID=2812953 RepID=A0A8J7UVP8_9BACT|nr:translocation/assembly module TamB domain-containing protein [Natronogracilivirga saccharolytica]MBP3192781.1 translocation/assembly module TamB domain-containing protein [Natronogracilivirga saccharolytica]